MTNNTRRKVLSFGTPVGNTYRRNYRLEDGTIQQLWSYR
jgi:hypothetical protein